MTDKEVTCLLQKVKEANAGLVSRAAEFVLKEPVNSQRIFLKELHDQIRFLPSRMERMLGKEVCEKIMKL